jgi:hypothetical protein
MVAYGLRACAGEWGARAGQLFPHPAGGTGLSPCKGQSCGGGGGGGGGGARAPGRPAPTRGGVGDFPLATGFNTPPPPPPPHTHTHN